MFKAIKYNKLMNNIGDITVKESHVSITVDNKVLEKMLDLTDNKLIIKSTHLKDKYNRPINYEIKDMNFANVTIYTDEGVTFKNCNFINGVNIVKADLVLFNNNKYINLDGEYNDQFFVGKNINSIIFYQENNTDQNVAFRIESKGVQLYDTALLGEVGHTNIKCDRLSMNNSRIGGTTSFIEAKTMILVEKSSVHNTKNCIIECPNINGENIFDAPRVIYNGKLYEKGKKKRKELK